ncbi:MAG: PAS domain S-box protein [Chloroflexi bacterium]|nr:PAS domain S-box protein [Chloroflexota bacterium]
MPHLDAVAPLFANNSPSAEPIGAVILQYNADHFLFPMIQTWPTSSPSAETLLVRRDGDSVLYLNELRHQKGTALSLRFPLSQLNLPAARVVLGQKAVADGTDYRGIEVLSATQGIPDSPWFIVSKVDRAEVFADLQLYSQLIFGLSLGTLALVITASGAVWQRNQKRYYRTLLQAEKARQEGEARYRTTLLSIGDGVIATDAEGRVTLMNPVAEALTGRTQTEASGKPLDDVFHIVNEESHQPLETPVRRVLGEGIVVGLANHSLLISKEGREPLIADSGAPIQTTDGSLAGVVLVFRDQTDERAAQEALRESYHKLEILFEMMPVGVSVINQDRQLVIQNPALGQMLDISIEGLGRGEYRQRKYLRSDGTPMPAEEFASTRVLNGEAAVHNVETGVVKENGDIIWTSVSAAAYPLRDWKVVIVTTDITERKRAEAAEYDQRMMAEALRDTAAALINALDLESVMNTTLEGVARVVPYEAANVMLVEDDAVRVVGALGYLPEYRTFLAGLRRFINQYAILRRMLETHRPSLVSHTDHDPDWVHDQEGKWIKSHVAAPLQSYGTVIGVLNFDSTIPGSFSEIHAERLQAFADQASLAFEHVQLYDQVRRHAAELEQRVDERTAQLNQAKERAETILSSSNDVIVLCHVDGRIDQANPAFYQTSDYQMGEVHNQPLTMLATPDSQARLEQAFAVAVETYQPQRLEVDIRCKSGESFEADVVLSPIVQHDVQLLGVVCSLRDMTEQKEMEVQLRQMLGHEMELSELKSRYVSMAAHDLRNPLASILAALETIERYNDRMTEDQRLSRFDSIHRSIEVMIELLNDILIVGHTQSGKLRFEPGPLDLIAFLEGLIAELQPLGSAQRIRFSFQEGRYAVSMDAKLLRHIMGNLLSNALKYSPEDSPVDLIIAREADAVIFGIQDRGIGIPQTDQAKLFDAFHRADNVGSTPGTGLGLTIVKQSVSLHNGTISFESDAGAGTLFTVVIPQPVS